MKFYCKSKSHLLLAACILFAFYYFLVGFSFKKIRYIQVRLDDEENENDQYVQYVCEDPHRVCGGFADRLKGILSSYALAVLLKRKFLISITQPCNFEQVLRPNRVDWLKLKSNNKGRLSTISVADFDLHQNFALLEKFKSIDFIEYLRDEQYLNAKLINVKTNLMLNNALAENPFLSSQLIEAGFMNQKAFKTHNLIYKWYHDLFKLAPKLEVKYQTLLRKAKPNTDTFLICAQVRVGGTSQNDVPDDLWFIQKNESLKFWTFINQQFILPNDKNNRSFGDDRNYRLFVTSDLDSVRQQAVEIFGEEFVVFNDQKPSHLDKDFENLGDNCEQIESTIVDFHMLQNCDASVVSHSGYGILGSWNRPVPNRNLHVFTKQNQTELMVNYGKRDDLVFKQIVDIEKELYLT